MMVRGETSGAELCFQTVYLTLSVDLLNLIHPLFCVSSTVCLFIPPIQCLFSWFPDASGWSLGLMVPSGREDSWMLESWEHTECQTIWSCSHRASLNNFIYLLNVSITRTAIFFSYNYVHSKVVAFFFLILRKVLNI